MFRFLAIAALFMAIPVSALAQTFSFGGRQAVEVVPADSDDLLSKFKSQGYVAFDSDGDPIEIFGPDAATVFTNNQLAIEGFALPEGGAIEAVGAFGITEAATELLAKRAASDQPSAQQLAINQTVDSITASNKSIEVMCSNPIHPSKISLRVKGAAGFPGLGAEAEATVEWDLAALCLRSAGQ